VSSLVFSSEGDAQEVAIRNKRLRLPFSFFLATIFIVMSVSYTVIPNGHNTIMKLLIYEVLGNVYFFVVARERCCPLKRTVIPER